MLLFNTTCVRNIDVYYVAKCWVCLPKAMIDTLIGLPISLLSVYSLLVVSFQ